MKSLRTVAKELHRRLRSSTANRCNKCGHVFYSKIPAQCPNCGAEAGEIIEVICDSCQGTAKFSYKLRGTTQKCPHCGQSSEIPRPQPWRWRRPSIWRSPMRKDPNRCVKCDYMLLGMERGTCPECGTAYDLIIQQQWDAHEATMWVIRRGLEHRIGGLLTVLFFGCLLISVGVFLTYKCVICKSTADDTDPMAVSHTIQWYARGNDAQYELLTLHVPVGMFVIAALIVIWDGWRSMGSWGMKSRTYRCLLYCIFAGMIALFLRSCTQMVSTTR
jgi:rubrerythrin